MNHLKPILAICLLAAAGAAPCQQAATTTTSQLNVGSMDLDAALLAVQQQRAALLDAQLKEQKQAIQARSDQLVKLDAAFFAGSILRAKFPADAKPDARTPAGAELTAFDLACKNAGVTARYPTLGELNGTLQNLRGAIDSGNNSQQMDILRLQSMSVNRNEALELMKNHVKKMQENRRGNTP